MKAAVRVLTYDCHPLAVSAIQLIHADCPVHKNTAPFQEFHLFWHLSVNNWFSVTSVCIFEDVGLYVHISALDFCFLSFSHF